MMNHKKYLGKLSEYLLYNSDFSNKLKYEEIVENETYIKY